MARVRPRGAQRRLARSVALVASALECIGTASAVADANSAEDLARLLFDAGVGQVVALDVPAWPRALIAADDGRAPEEEEGDSVDASRTPLLEGGAGAAMPVVMLHGTGDFAQNPMGMLKLKAIIAREAGAYVHSVELCSTPEQLVNCPAEDQRNGFLMTMDKQVEQFARVVRADPQLAGGFNAVGLSQGNLVIRGYIHRYNDPPVRTFLSMHGTMMGVAGLPHCPLEVPGLGALCKTVDALASLGVYTHFVQHRLAQANYYRDPKRMDTYRKEGNFLPFLNNEGPGEANETYARNFRSLERLVLVMAEDDTMIHPKESEHFGYFEDGSMSQLVEMRSSRWYSEDWFGLRSLDEARRVDQYTTPGDHLRFSNVFMTQIVRKYFAAATPIQI